MITRIVKMSFAPEHVNDFLEIFGSSGHLIRNFKGCTHLELLNEQDKKNVFFTYSHWESENALDDYRRSELFAGVWARTKILFDNKPEAWTVVQHTVVT